MKRTYILILALCVLAGAKAQKFYNLRYCLELGLQNNYDLRIAHNNEEISDIIERMPTRFGKHIAIAVVLFALIITGLGWIIQYPDVVTGQVTINSDTSPVTLIAGSSGKIHLNGIRPRDAVREGDYLAVLQNAANTADVRRVARLLGGFNPNAPVSEWADTLPEKLSLGELNLKYFTFLSAVKTLRDYQKDNTYEQQIKSLEEYIHWQRLLLEQTAADTATTLAKLNMLDKWLKRQNRLYGKDMIPEKEYDDMRTSRLNAYAEDRQLHRSLTSLHAQIAEAEGSLNLLRTQKAENERNMHLDLLSAYSDLLDNIKTWEEKYVFKAQRLLSPTVNSNWHKICLGNKPALNLLLFTLIFPVSPQYPHECRPTVPQSPGEQTPLPS